MSQSRKVLSKNRRQCCLSRQINRVVILRLTSKLISNLRLQVIFIFKELLFTTPPKSAKSKNRNLARILCLQSSKKLLKNLRQLRLSVYGKAEIKNGRVLCLFMFNLIGERIDREQILERCARWVCAGPTKRNVTYGRGPTTQNSAKIDKMAAKAL